MPETKSVLRVLLSVAVSALFVWLSLRHTDVWAVWAAMRAADPRPIAAYLALLLVVHLVRTVRWGLLLEPLGHVGFRRLNSASAVGYMLLVLLPLRLGELARPLLVARTRDGKGPQLSRSGTLASCFVERVVDGIGVGALGVVALRLLGASARGPAADFARRASVLVTLGFVALCACLCAAYFMREWSVGLVRRIAGRLSPRLAERAASMLDSFISALHFGSGWRAVAVLVLTAIHWSLHVLGFYLLAPAFGMQLTVLMTCAVLAAQVVGVMIPAGPGMIGTSQFFTELGLSIFIPGVLTAPDLAARAAGYANTIWALQFGQQVGLGLIFWIGGGVSLAGVIGRREAEPQPRPKSEARSASSYLRALVLALALGGFAWRAFSTAAVYNHTFDEPTQIASGMELLQYRTFDVHIDVPPLAKALLAAPLYLAGVRMDAPPRRGHFEEASAFLYDKTPYWPALRAARATSTLLGLLLLIGIYMVCLRLFGPLGALAGVVTASISPGLVSAASIANSDMAGVLTMLLALLAWRRWLEAPSTARGALCGAAVGLAVAAKLSALPFIVFSFPVVAVVLLGKRALEPLRHPLRWMGAHGAEVALAAVAVPLVIWASYGFGLAPPISEAQAASVSASLQGRSPALASLVGGLGHANLPLGAFLRGVGAASVIARQGHPAYLMGNYSLHGWPYYFLVTLALKVPLGIWAAALLSLALALAAREQAAAREVFLAAAVAAAIFVSVARAGINAGHRHVVIVEALLALIIAGGVQLAFSLRRPLRRVALGAFALALSLATISSYRAHPDALGYTNALAGNRPDWWFVDSNLDWGQDLQRLSKWVNERGITEPIHLAYFGTAWPDRHGLNSVPLLPDERPTGWIAASVQYQRGLRDSGIGVLPTLEQRQGYAWLLQLPEVTQIGTSIRVYHVSKEDLESLYAARKVN